MQSINHNAAISANPSDCFWIISILVSMGINAAFDPQHPNACCQMDGITCKEEKVTQILLRNKNLTMTIPSEIGELRNLERLYISQI